jgi:hypothetical protein
MGGGAWRSCPKTVSRNQSPLAISTPFTATITPTIAKSHINLKTWTSISILSPGIRGLETSFH